MNIAAGDLLSSQDFRTLVRDAKRAAYAGDAQKLELDHLLCGLLLSTRAAALSGVASLDPAQAEACEGAVARLGIDLSTLAESGADQKWVLSTGVRDLIRQSRGVDFVTFVRRLCESPGAAKGGDTAAKPRHTSRDDGHFHRILLCAHSIAESYAINELNLELFAAGTVLAFRHGMLSDRPAIAHTVLANTGVTDYLLRARRWDLSQLKPRSVPLDLSESAAFAESLQETSSHEDPLLALVNQGLAEGVAIRLRERIAYHESGHAVVSMLLMPERDIAEVTILAEGDADGQVCYDTSSVWLRTPTSKEDVSEILRVCLAGRVAEQRSAGPIAGSDVGAISDLRVATTTAWNAITEWGMDDAFGPIVLEVCTEQSGLKSGWLFEAAQQRLQQMMKEAYLLTEQLIEANWPLVDRLARALIERERLTQDEMLSVVPELVSKDLNS